VPIAVTYTNFALHTLYVSYNSQNEQQLPPETALTSWAVLERS